MQSEWESATERNIPMLGKQDCGGQEPCSDTYN